MRVAGFDRIRWIEMSVGLLPITLLLGPLLPYALLMVSVSVLIGGSAGINVLKTSDGSLQLVLSVVCATTGLPALWVAFLFDPIYLRSRPICYWLVAALLLAGLAADLYWIRLLLFSPDRIRGNAYAFLWALLLIAPLIVAMKYLYLLLKPSHSFRSD